jgi:hypothetical protein
MDSKSKSKTKWTPCAPLVEVAQVQEAAEVPSTFLLGAFSFLALAAFLSSAALEWALVITSPILRSAQRAHRVQ